MTDLHMPRPLTDTELDAALDAVSPEQRVDYGALGRARQQLTVTMATGSVHRLDADRRRVSMRRRIAWTGIAAASAAAAVIVASLHGTTSANAPQASAPHLLPVAQSANGAFGLAAARLTSGTPIASGDYVKVIQQMTSLSHVGGHGERIAHPTPVVETLTTWRPADLTSDGLWVQRDSWSNGGVTSTAPGRCGIFSDVDPGLSHCLPGTWQEPSPAFAAKLATVPSADLAAQMRSEAEAHPLEKSTVDESLFSFATSALTVAAGDHAATGRIYEALAIIASSTPGWDVQTTATQYRIVHQDGPNHETDTLLVSRATGDLAGFSAHGSDFIDADATITISQVGADDVPAVDPPQNPSSTASASSASSAAPAPGH